MSGPLQAYDASETMRALRWHGREDVRYETVDKPPMPSTGFAVIEVDYCGLCGTDLHEYSHGPNMIRQQPHPLSGSEPPVTLGHEFSGTIAAIGDEDSGFSVGDRVTVDPCLKCGSCFWCRTGDYHICTKGGSLGLAADGGFAEYVSVPTYQLQAVPDGVDLAQAAVAEPIAVGLHSAARGEIGPGDRVLILGAGPIGIAALMGAVVAGAGAVYVSEPNAARAEQARQFGATEVFDSQTTDVRREVFLRTGRIGPDVVIDGTGIPAVIAEAVRTVRRGGTVVMTGISDSEVPVDLRQVVLMERNIRGSLGYNYDISRVLELIDNGRLDVTGFVTDTRPMSEGPELLKELTSDRGHHLKVLLSPKEN